MNSFIKHYKIATKKKWQSWIERRIPASIEVVLSQKSIFIVPSKTGWMFSLLLVLLLVTAINYQNNLIFALTFWLFSIGLSAMILTYRNLAGLKVRISHRVTGFSGETIEIPIIINDESKSHQGLSFSWPQKRIKKNLQVQIAEVHKEEEKELLIPYVLDQRGYLKTERFKIDTRYPFGLYTSWTWLRLKTPGLVYPKPIFTPFIVSEGQGDDDDVSTDANLSVGNDEFLGLRSYQPGDPLKHIAWKYLAKGKGLLTKEYDNQQLSMKWLDWYSLQGLDIESRLSHLTGWVLQAEKEGRAYGLNLPGIKIQPSAGDGHRDHCLKCLALYNLKEEEV